MKTLIEMWNILVQSNTFNFLVMVCLVVFLVKKYNLVQILDKMVKDTSNSVKAAEQEKINANEKFIQVNKSVENLDFEISERLTNAKQQALGTAKAIKEKALLKTKTIEENLKKSIISEESLLSDNLIQETAIQSSKLAFEKFKKILKESPQLHEKLINQSIEEL